MPKHIQLFTLGGTIAYVGEDQSSLSGEDLIQAIPQMKQENIKLTIIPFLTKASSALAINDLIKLSEKIKKAAEQGVDGIVITQGTDTIEESAFLLDLLTEHKVPIVMTGAMRNPTLAGAEGPANLYAALKVAADEEAKSLGVLVVFNDEIHTARFVQKRHTENVAAFASDYGKLGWVSEGEPRIVTQFKKEYPSILKNLKIENEDISVALLTAAMDSDARLIEAVANLGYDALVIEGLGGGHVPEVMVDPLIALAKEIPVILTSRINRGEILTNTYKGYKGSETYLLEGGLISSGWLDSRKARILLYLLLASGKNKAEIKEVFQFFQQ